MRLHKHFSITVTFIIFGFFRLNAQDLSQGLLVNDLSAHNMQDIAKPNYLGTITDPSFGTTIRRITNAAVGEVIVPMYSTVQAWNTDESYMILYEQTTGSHQLLDGKTYEFIRYLDDVAPADIEQLFWDFNNPDILYYLDNLSDDFIRYTVSTKEKETIVNLKILSGCNESISMGNDIQMMSWDNEVFTFRCGNSTNYSYQISTETLIEFDLNDVNYTATATAASGTLYYHKNKIYNDSGDEKFPLNEASVEHSCIGKLSNGNDAFFATAFAEGPSGGCIGDIVAHDMTTGNCFTITSQDQGYDYSQSGTHISSLAHKNTEGGWIAASMIGYGQDGQSLLDQELIVAKADEQNIKVCRIGHHRSDRDQFGYWGEPHAVISPSGTRVLFGSDWSGPEDGKSVDSYVVELPSYAIISGIDSDQDNLESSVSPNPVEDISYLTINNHLKKSESTLTIFNMNEVIIHSQTLTEESYKIDKKMFLSGMYFYNITDKNGKNNVGKFIVN